MKKIKQWAAAGILGSVLAGVIALVLVALYATGGAWLFGLTVLVLGAFGWALQTYVEHGFPWEK